MTYGNHSQGAGEGENSAGVVAVIHVPLGPREARRPPGQLVLRRTFCCSSTMAHARMDERARPQTQGGRDAPKAIHGV